MPATAGVKQLIEDVLATCSKPYSEDVIDEVFLAIEQNPMWLQRYNDLCNEHTRFVVNSQGGQWISKAVGSKGDHQVPAQSGLIESYSKLL